jgi:lysophospholipase L1-like esterase
MLKLKNDGATTLSANISSSVTSVTVTDGSVFPALAAGDWFPLTLIKGSNVERMRVTARAGNTLTVIRKEEGTNAQAWVAGDNCTLSVTAGAFAAIKKPVNTIDAANTSDAISGAAVYREVLKERVKSSRYRASKNLLDLGDDSITQGYFINSSGNYQVNEDYLVTGYVLVNEGETLINNWGTANVSCELYDEDFNVVYTSPSGENLLAWVENAVYGRFSMPTSSVNPQVEVGTVISDYEVFTQKTPVERIANTFDPADVERSITAFAANAEINQRIAETQRMVTGKNLLDVDNEKMTAGFFIHSNGNYVENPLTKISHYIHIKPGETLINNWTNSNISCQLYDKYFNVIYTSEAGANSLTYIDGAVYARFSLYSSNANPQVEIGTVITEYSPYVIDNLQQDLVAVASDVLQLQEADFQSQINAVTDNLVDYKNLFDKDTAFAGYLNSSGAPSAVGSSTYDVISNYIPLAEGQQIAFTSDIRLSGAYTVVQYDIDKVKIDASTYAGYTFITGIAEVKYIRFTSNINTTDTTMIVYGEVVEEEYSSFNEISLKPALLQEVQDHIDANLNAIQLQEEKLQTNINAVTNNIIDYKNLFDKDTAFAGYLNSSGTPDGVGVSTYDVISNYIRLTEGQRIAFTSDIKLSGAYTVVQYDIDKVKIDASTYAGATYIEGVADAQYVRFTSNINTTDTTVIVYGEVVGEEYNPFNTNSVKPALLTDIQDQIDTFHANLIAAVPEYVPDKNLFDKTKTTDGKFIAGSGKGAFNANASYEVSDYIRLDEDQLLTAQGADNFSSPFGVYTYDADKNWLSVHGEGSSTITGQANSYYIRVTNLISVRDIVQYEHGASATDYEDYREVLSDEILPSLLLNSKRIVLPDTIYMKSGSNPSVYLDNIAYAPLKEQKNISFSEGETLNRQWNYTGISLGDNAVDITYRSNDFDFFNQGALVNVVGLDSTVNNGKTVNLLCVGDSFSDIGTWVEETKILLEADGVTVNLQGTKGADSKLAESLSGGYMKNFLLNAYDTARVCTVSGVTTKPSTGYPGAKYTDSNGTQWTAIGGKLTAGGGLLSFSLDGGNQPASEMPASGVLTKVSGTGDATINYDSWVLGNRNPLYNPNTGTILDFSYYKTLWSFPTPDILALQFTFNDLGNRLAEVDPTVADAKQVIDSFHAEYPTAKVVYSIEPPGAYNNSIRDTNGYLKAFLLFVEAMKVQFEHDVNYNDFVIIAPSYAFVDLVNGYGPNTITPSSRYPDITEVYGADGVHCNDTGMRQIADCVVPVIHKLLI